MTKKELIEKYITQKKIDYVILLGAFLIGIYFDWAIIEAIIFVIFIAIILKPIPGRFLAIPALFCLTITPFLLILEKNERAEEFAIYAYYFLVMAVIMEVYAIRKDPNPNEFSGKLAGEGADNPQTKSPQQKSEISEGAREGAGEARGAGKK